MFSLGEFGDKLQQMIDNPLISAQKYLNNPQSILKLSKDVKALTNNISGEVKALTDSISGEVKALTDSISGEVKALTNNISGTKPSASISQSNVSSVAEPEPTRRMEPKSQPESKELQEELQEELKKINGEYKKTIQQIEKSDTLNIDPWLRKESLILAKLAVHKNLYEQCHEICRIRNTNYIYHDNQPEPLTGKINGTKKATAELKIHAQKLTDNQLLIKKDTYTLQFEKQQLMQKMLDFIDDFSIKWQASSITLNKYSCYNAARAVINDSFNKINSYKLYKFSEYSLTELNTTLEAWTEEIADRDERTVDSIKAVNDDFYARKSRIDDMLDFFKRRRAGDWVGLMNKYQQLKTIRIYSQEIVDLNFTKLEALESELSAVIRSEFENRLFRLNKKITDLKGKSNDSNVEKKLKFLQSPMDLNALLAFECGLLIQECQVKILESHESSLHRRYQSNIIINDQDHYKLMKEWSFLKKYMNSEALQKFEAVLTAGENHMRLRLMRSAPVAIFLQSVKQEIETLNNEMIIEKDDAGAIEDAEDVRLTILNSLHGSLQKILNDYTTLQMTPDSFIQSATAAIEAGLNPDNLRSFTHDSDGFGLLSGFIYTCISWLESLIKTLTLDTYTPRFFVENREIHMTCATKIAIERLNNLKNELNLNNAVPENLQQEPKTTGSAVQERVRAFQPQ